MQKKAILAAAANSVGWPGINGHIKSKYTNCIICMQIRRTNNPSTPVSEAAANIQIMDILSLDWMSIGSLHFLIIVEKVTSFIWAKLFGHMTTYDSLSMLSDIIAENVRPKMVVRDSGPSFRGEFIQSLQDLHIDQSPSSTYLAKTNERSERAV